MSFEIALKILKKKMIKFSSPIEFNDPYESQIYIKDYSIKDYRDKCYNTKTKINTLFYRLRDYNIVSNRNQFNDIFYNDFELNKIMDSEKAQLIQPWINNFPRLIGNTFRIYCLTHDPENLLMWSHYADSHYGVVLGFEFDRDINDKIFDIDYSPMKYQLGIEYCYGEKFSKEFMNSVLLRKSDIWKYENEVRLILPIFNLSKMSDDMYGLKIYKHNIKRIILGSKIDISQLKEIEELIQRQYSHINPEIALLKQHEFKMIIKDLRQSLDNYIKERENNEMLFQDFIVANNK